MATASSAALPAGVIVRDGAGERGDGAAGCRKKVESVLPCCQLQGDCNLHKNSLVMRQVDKTQEPAGWRSESLSNLSPPTLRSRSRSRSSQSL